MSARVAIVIGLACLAIVRAQESRRPAALVGAVSEHEARRGDSWISLGARAGVSPVTLARRNGRNASDALRPGERITIDARHIVPVNPDGASIIVNVPQRLLFLYRDGVLAAHYPVAVGRPDWRTPLGAFTIREREQDPTWDVPVSIQEEMRREGKQVLTNVPPGPANPLGRHWLGLTLPGLGIHGTNVPTSIYRSTTHGCIRMHPDDVAALFDQVRVGASGRTMYEPVLVGLTGDGRLWLEVHPDIYRRVPRPLDVALDLIARAGFGDVIDRAAVARVVSAREGVATEIRFVSGSDRAAGRVRASADRTSRCGSAPGRD